MAKQKSATRRVLFWTFGIIGILVVLVVVGRLTGLLGEKNKMEEVEAATADKRTITQIVTASGKVQPEVEVKISPDVSGEIIELRVKEGDQVQQGALLARIKPDFYVAQVEQAQAGVSQSQANMAQRKADLLRAELEFQRQKDLHDRGVVSDSDFLTAKTQFDVATASFNAAGFAVESAEARLKEAKEQLAKTTIYSPMTGTVSKLNVEPGERVVGTSQMAGTEMMIVAKLDLMELEVDVNENDVVNVAIGDSASIEIDAYPERKFKGVVTEIANSARITGAGSQEQVTNFPVKIRILDAHNVDLATAGPASDGIRSDEVPLQALDAVLRPGMSGTVDVYSETVFDVIAVPIQAVTVRDYSKTKPDSTEKLTQETEENLAKDGDPEKEDLRKVVFIVENGKVHMVEVETGISDDTHVEVKSGLAGAELVVTGPYRAVSRILEPDMMVRVKEDDKRTSATVLAVTN